MKKLLSYALALSCITSLALPYTTAYASTGSTASSNVSIISLGDSNTSMNHGNSVGYYLEQDITQGLEFTILGEGDFVLTQDTINGGYYLVDGIKDSAQLSSIMGGKLSPAKSHKASRSSSYDDPSTAISKTSGSRTLKGVWWGGILDDVGIVGSVAASTKATSSSTQSKASVRPGSTASWASSDWKNTNVIASVMKSVGVAGNQSKWDLQAK